MSKGKQQQFGKNRVEIHSGNATCTKEVKKEKGESTVSGDSSYSFTNVLEDCGSNAKIAIRFMGGMEYRCIQHSKETWLRMALHRWLAEGQPPKHKSIAKEIDLKLHKDG